jgi:hypothetical protein
MKSAWNDPTNPCCFPLINLVLHGDQKDYDGTSCKSIEMGLLGFSIQFGWYLN